MISNGGGSSGSNGNEKDKVKQLLKEESVFNMSPISIGSPSIGTPNTVGSSSPSFLIKFQKSPSAYEIGDMKEKIQHLGWISTPNNHGIINKSRQRSNSMAIGSPGSMTFLTHQLEELSKQLEEKEKDAMLAAEIGRELLERNQLLEDRLSQFQEMETKYQDDTSNIHFLKNQNEILNGTLKEAEIENEFLFEKLNQDNNSSKKFLSAHRIHGKGSVNKSEGDIDKLNLEIEELKGKESNREKNLQRIRNEKELLNQRLLELENEVNNSFESLKEIEELKDKNRRLSLKNKTLKSFSEMNVRKSIIEEFNGLKDSCQITLDSLITSTNSMIKEFKVDSEIQFLNHTKILLDSFEINDEMNEPIVVQLINKIRDIDNSNSSTNGNVINKISKYNDSPVISNSLQQEQHLPGVSESSSNNILRSSLLLILSMYMVNRQRQFDEKIQMEKIRIKELTEDYNELNIKLSTSNKLNSKLENTLECIKGESLQLKESIQSLIDKHQEELDQLLLKQQEELGQWKEKVENLKVGDDQLKNQLKQLGDTELLLKREIESLRNQECKECNELNIINNELLKDVESKESMELELEIIKNKQCQECKEFNRLDDELTSKVQYQSNQILQMELNYQNEIKELKMTNNEKKSDYDEKLKLIESQLNLEVHELQEKLKEFNRMEIENKEGKERIRELESQIKVMEERECSSCNQYKLEISQVLHRETELHSKLELLESKLNQSVLLNKEFEIKLLELESRECENCKLNRNQIEEVELKLTKSMKELEDMVQEYKEKVRELENRECEICKSNRTHIEELELKLTKSFNSSKEFEITISDLQEKEKRYQEEIEKLEIKVRLLEDQLSNRSDDIKTLENNLQTQKKMDHDRLVNLENEIEQIQQLQTQHICNVDTIPEFEVSLIHFTNLELGSEVVLYRDKCRECTMKLFIDGRVYSELMNHYYNESIDQRALHKNCNSRQDYLENLSLIINSLKGIAMSSSTSFSLNDLVDMKGTEIFKLLFDIFYNGILNQVSLQFHSELSHLWKNNPEAIENTTTEKWENFIVLDPQYLLKRWVNFILKSESQPMISNLSKDIKDFKVLNIILTHLHSFDPNQDSNSIFNYLKSTLNISQLTSKDDIELAQEQKILLLLTQIFKIKNGLETFKKSKSIPSPVNISTNSSTTSIPNISNINNNNNNSNINSPPLQHQQKLQHTNSSNSLMRMSSLDNLNEIIAPSSEEKACKVWLKSIDIHISNLDDFKDGILLLKTLDKIENGIVNWKSVTMNSNNTFQMTENCNYAVKLGKQMKFSLVGIAGKDFVDSNKKFLLSFVWQMMRLHVLQSFKTGSSKDFTENDLIKKLNQFLLENKKKSTIKSFSDPSLSNGISLIDLLDSIHNGSIDYSEVIYDDSTLASKRSNAKYFISVARRLGCTAIIFAEDIIDVKSNMILNFICDLLSITNSLSIIQ